MIIIVIVIKKNIFLYIIGLIRRRCYNRRRIIIIGTGQRTKEFINSLKLNIEPSLDIIGIISLEKEKIGKNYFGYAVLGTLENFEELLKEFNPEEVFVTISTHRIDNLRFIMETCERAGISVRLISDSFLSSAKYVKVETFYGLNIISLSFTKHNKIDLLIKRIIDIVGSSLLIIILSPLFLAISIAIYLSDGFPIFYEWKIVGYKGKPIKSWKFRTMVKNADELKINLLSKNEMSGPVFKVSNDPRIIKIGHFLRKYSLDELPQLFSVLKGDLSLVGPRPPLQSEFKKFDLRSRKKLSVKPGLTCLWQISGRNNISDFDEWIRLDLEYIDNWSVLLDIKILLKTIPAVITGRGAK